MTKLISIGLHVRITLSWQEARERLNGQQGTSRGVNVAFHEKGSLSGYVHGGRNALILVYFSLCLFNLEVYTNTTSEFYLLTVCGLGKTHNLWRIMFPFL